MIIIDNADDVTRKKIMGSNVYNILAANPAKLLQDLPDIVWHNGILYSIDGNDHKPISDWWAILTQIASNQIEQSQTVTPTQMFLTAVGQLMATAMIYVDDINSPPIINHKIGKKVGYADTDNYYFYHNIIYEAVINYYSRLRQTYPISCQRLLKRLADEGISITSRGRYVYQKRIGNANDRYLCIPKSYIDYQSGGQDDGNTD